MALPKRYEPGIVEHGAHVQDASHIGRWHEYGVGLTFIGLGVKIPLVHPVVVPFLLYTSGFISLRQGHSVSFFCKIRIYH
jgi:hypothetical protein